MQNHIRIAISTQRGGIVKDDPPEYKWLGRIAFNKAMTI
jgi:hypothetical protein